VYSAPDASVFQYSEGRDATIVGFNFGLNEGRILQQRLEEAGLTASLFSANYVPEPAWDRILQSVAVTRKIVVIDDSKSVHLPCYTLLDRIHAAGIEFKRTVVTRTNIDFGMTDDRFAVDYDGIVRSLRG
jgi:hypothetical protein